MTFPIGDDDLGSDYSFATANAASLGRISGKLLAANLLRNGSDLTFRSASNSPDLLYLDVTNKRIGIEGKRTLPAVLDRASGSLPVYDLDVNDTVKTNFLETDTQINVGNLTFNANGNIGSTTGPIIIRTSDLYGVTYFAEILSDFLLFNDNKISSISNRNIRLDPNGTGRVVFEANTLMQGNLGVTGNIVMDGNLASAGTITVGDTQLDTVTVGTDFTQSIIPGDNITYDLGKSNKRWSELHVPDLTQVVTNLPLSVRVSDQMLIDGVVNKISGIQSNEDIELLPDTGIVYIERTKWQDNDLTNLNNTALTFASTGIGYTRFVTTNAMIIPAGTDAERRANPEVGETRWNTTQGYLECFDGSVWAVSTGGGEEVTGVIMEDLSHIWTLTLG